MKYRLLFVGLLCLGLSASAQTPNKHVFITDDKPIPGLPFDLNPTINGHRYGHVMPTNAIRAKIAAAIKAAGPLTSLNALGYGNGNIMRRVQAYVIYKNPSSGLLQDGVTTTSIPTAYATLANRFLTDYLGHAPGALLTQYYQTTGGFKDHFTNQAGVGFASALVATVTDSANYVAHGTACGTNVNCIDDTAIQNIITSAMTAQGWTAGPNKVFIVVTSSTEQVCVTTSECSDLANGTGAICGYHNDITGTTPTNYIVVPFVNDASSTGCGSPTNPNGSATNDGMTIILGHELAETITDPHFDGWHIGTTEIADACGLPGGLSKDIYGPKIYTSQSANDANQQWGNTTTAEDFYIQETLLDNSAWFNGSGTLNGFQVANCAETGPQMFQCDSSDTSGTCGVFTK